MSDPVKSNILSRMIAAFGTVPTSEDKIIAQNRQKTQRNQGFHRKSLAPAALRAQIDTHANANC
jgi:hypothetical protein